MTLDEFMRSMEREAIYIALLEAQWNFTQAARDLGISYRSMRYRCETVGIGIRSFPAAFRSTRQPKLSRFEKEWPALRMAILRRDGSRCTACGATPSDGVRMHVDHIKPKGRYPELALDPGNLQVLCEYCNVCKGSRDETDWRLVVNQATDHNMQ